MESILRKARHVGALLRNLCAISLNFLRGRATFFWREGEEEEEVC